MKSNIMLIEDDHTMVTLLTTLLRYEGFETAILKNDDDLDTILKAIRGEQPDVILLDVHLRRVNGLDLLRAVREDPDTRRVGVIISSGMDVSQRCLELGANAFILKPYMPDDLLKKIRQVLANAELRE
jgi:DNA-binding response OmpR family regulator